MVVVVTVSGCGHCDVTMVTTCIVQTWDGDKSLLDVREKEAESRSRRGRDEWDEEYDRGKVGVVRVWVWLRYSIVPLDKEG